jgi:hypothetical protein
MDVLLRNGDKLTCTPDEYARLVELGVVRQDVPFVTNKNIGISESNRAEERRIDQEGKPFIDPDQFFTRISKTMARILSSLIEHGGRIAQSTLTQEIDANGKSLHGKSLRRPNGALNVRIRQASAGRIKGFYEVHESDKANGDADRIYTVSPEILQFLQANVDKIPRTA